MKLLRIGSAWSSSPSARAARPVRWPRAASGCPRQGCRGRGAAGGPRPAGRPASKKSSVGTERACRSKSARRQTWTNDTSWTRWPRAAHDGSPASGGRVDDPAPGPFDVGFPGSPFGTGFASASVAVRGRLASRSATISRARAWNSGLMLSAPRPETACSAAGRFACAARFPAVRASAAPGRKVIWQALGTGPRWQGDPRTRRRNRTPRRGRGSSQGSSPALSLRFGAPNAGSRPARPRGNGRARPVARVADDPVRRPACRCRSGSRRPEERPSGARGPLFLRHRLPSLLGRFQILQRLRVLPGQGNGIGPVPLRRQRVGLARQPTLGIEDRPGLEHFVRRVPVKLGQDTQVCVGPNQGAQKSRRLPLGSHHVADLSRRLELR